MSESEKDPQETKEPFQFNWSASADDKSGDGLQSGLAAFGKMLEGLVKMAGGVGAETIRNGLAASWLDGVATSLEDAVKTTLDTRKPPSGRSGEVACFLDRVEAELKETKYESQTAGFRQQLQDASELLKRLHVPAETTTFDADIGKLSDVAGYFRGAAGSRQTQTASSSGNETT